MRLFGLLARFSSKNGSKPRIQGIMVFSMNTIAFGDEIVAEEAVVTDAEAVVTAETSSAASTDDAFEQYGVGGIQLEHGTNKCVTVVNEFKAKDDKKKSPKNLAVIENTSDPMSWNNLYGRSLFKTILEGAETDDNYLNNTKVLTVSGNRDPQQTNTWIENYPTRMKTEFDVNGYSNPEFYKALEVDKANGIWLLVGYKFTTGNALTTEDRVAGEWKYEGKDVAPVEANTSGTDVMNRITSVPLTIWNGGTVGFAKKGTTITAKKTNILDVKASLVEYKNKTVTELEQLDVTGITLKDKKAVKQASVEYAGSEAKAKDENDTEKTFTEHKVIGKLPEFNVKAKVSKKNKKYKNAVKKALKDNSFKFGVVQNAIMVKDPTMGTKIADEYFDPAKGHFEVDTTTNETKKVNAASANDGKELTDVVDAEYNDNAIAFFDADDLSGLDEIKGLAGTAGQTWFNLKKFSGEKSTFQLQKALCKNGKWSDKDAKVKLGKKDAKFVKGTLAGGKEVYYLDLIGSNYVYANADPQSGDQDLSAFGYKWAFRKDPNNKKNFRYGIYATTDTGFVYNAK